VSEPSSALSSGWFGLPAWLRGLVRAGERVGGIPWAPPAILVAAQWAAVAAFAGAAEHNGWLYFQGGEQLWHYTSAWLLSNATLPPAIVGYVWPFLLSPIALFADADLLSALPAIVLFQVVILLPVAVLCIYSIATRLGGRLFGFLAGGVWIVLPYAAVPLFDPRYHERYADQFLPQALGLTGMSDFPSMVAVLVAATFAFRVFEAPSPRLADAVAAGAAAGLAVGLRPANLMFVPGLLVGLALARRWREAAAAAAALAPALVVLVVWKKLGLGEVPAFVETEVAVRPGAPRISVVQRYLDLDWAQLERNEDYLREFFWSVRLLEWAAIAGIVAVARRSRPAAAFLALWLGVFLIGKGTSHLADVQAGTFFRLLMPAFPAFFLLAMALVLLVPGLGGTIARRAGRERPAGADRSTWLLAGVLLALAVAPLPAIVAAEPLRRPEAVSDSATNTFIPVSASWSLETTRRPDGTWLVWERPDSPGSISFRVLRAKRGESLACSKSSRRPAICVLGMSPVANVTGTSFFAADPPEENWVYRVGLVANPSGDERAGDIILLTPEADPLGL
jgi:hypothetical protein